MAGFDDEEMEFDCLVGQEDEYEHFFDCDEPQQAGDDEFAAFMNPPEQDTGMEEACASDATNSDMHGEDVQADPVTDSVESTSGTLSGSQSGDSSNVLSNTSSDRPVLPMAENLCPSSIEHHSSTVVSTLRPLVLAGDGKRRRLNGKQNVLQEVPDEIAALNLRRLNVEVVYDNLKSDKKNMLHRIMFESICVVKASGCGTGSQLHCVMGSRCSAPQRESTTVTKTMFASICCMTWHTRVVCQRVWQGGRPSAGIWKLGMLVNDDYYYMNQVILSKPSFGVSNLLLDLSRGMVILACLN